MPADPSASHEAQDPLHQEAEHEDVLEAVVDPVALLVLLRRLPRDMDRVECLIFNTPFT